MLLCSCYTTTIGAVVDCCLTGGGAAGKEKFMTAEKENKDHALWVSWETMAGGRFGTPGSGEMDWSPPTLPGYDEDVPWINVTMSQVKNTLGYKTVSNVNIMCTLC